MLAVTVEVWPGGSLPRRRVIHTIAMVNETGLADVSDYSVYVDGVRCDDYKGHHREDGALALIAKVLEQEGYTQTIERE